VNPYEAAQGQVIAGRYRLLDKLGEGGMGCVWRAQHVELGAFAAVKLMDSTLACNPEGLARFRREAQAAAALQNSHIVHVFDYGVEQGSPFIAMELLNGESLAARLQRVGRLSPIETGEIFLQAASALSHAHQMGIVHRDLKPDNMFLVRQGDKEIVKLLDFGIAKKVGPALGDGIKTHTGTMLGTPYYMSPEQSYGRPDVNHLTDIWSMGVIAFECLAGRRPFEGELLSTVLLAICSDPIAVPSSVAPVPAGFDEWFARAVARDRTRRFQSVAEAAVGLRAICRVRSDQPVGTAPPQEALSVTALPDSREYVSAPLVMSQTAAPSSVTIRRTRRAPVVWAVLAVCLAVVAAVAAAVWPVRTVPDATALPSAQANGTAVSAAVPGSTPAELPAASVASTASSSPGPSASSAPVQLRTDTAPSAAPPRTRAGQATRRTSRRAGPDRPEDFGF
jgi:eukaryotic-like serine/threonine-protein kinase